VYTPGGGVLVAVRARARDFGDRRRPAHLASSRAAVGRVLHVTELQRCGSGRDLSVPGSRATGVTLQPR
jgi:hypothetical protein